MSCYSKNNESLCKFITINRKSDPKRWIPRLVNRWRTQQSAISTVNCRFLWISRILNALCAMWFFHIAGLYQRRLNPLNDLLLRVFACKGFCVLAATLAHSWHNPHWMWTVQVQLVQDITWFTHLNSTTSYGSSYCCKARILSFDIDVSNSPRASVSNTDKQLLMTWHRPEYPLNLSISVSGGKETN